MSSLTNKLNESFDNLDSYTLNEDDKSYEIPTDRGDMITIIPGEKEIMGFKCTYVDGIEEGMSFGLRMLGIRNTNVYGSVIEATPELIKVQHPNHDSIYEIPTNNVSINGDELRFYPQDKDYRWFGFIDLEKSYYKLEDLEQNQDREEKTSGRVLTPTHSKNPYWDGNRYGI